MVFIHKQTGDLILLVSTLLDDRGVVHFIYQAAGALPEGAYITADCDFLGWL